MSTDQRSSPSPPPRRAAPGRVAPQVAGEAPAASVRLPLTARQRARARALFDLGSSARVLAALDAGDPLSIAERVHHCLRRGAWLVDPGELQRAALARIALHAADWRGRPRLEAWLDEQIDAALAELVDRDPYARFHRLPREVRDVCCRALLDGEDPEALARRRCGDLSRLGRMLLLGLQALLEDSAPFPRDSRSEPVTPSEPARPSGDPCP
ncbi:MAG: hypothetical protein ACYS26_14490 [Planctomycetota bacterium]